MDIRPATPGHPLVVPRCHRASRVDMEPEIAVHLMRLAARPDAALRAPGALCQGVNLLLADGGAASQDAFYVPLNLVPRSHGDGSRLTAAWASPAREELVELAARIRSALISPGRWGIMTPEKIV
jgi:histidine triad (HIT) family protein